VQKQTRAVVVALNYHRVGPADPEDPSAMLHTVGEAAFRRQVAVMSAIGRFVSLDEVYEARGLGRLNFLLSFDDVSRTVLSAADFLDGRSIPYAVCPCAQITERGYGVRDKVYWIVRRLSPEEIFEAVAAQTGRQALPEPPDFSFYRFTKQAGCDPGWMERQIIDPLFGRIPGAQAGIVDARAYLTWEELRSRFLGNPLVTVVNHGYSHAPMADMSPEELAAEVDRSGQAFRRNLDLAPAYFAVPFGGPTPSLVQRLGGVVRGAGYRGILWVCRFAHRVRGPCRDLLNLPRIHAPRGSWRMLRRLPSYIRRSVPNPWPSGTAGA